MLSLNNLFKFPFIRKGQCCCMECISGSNQHLGTAPKIITFDDEKFKLTTCWCRMCMENIFGCQTVAANSHGSKDNSYNYDIVIWASYTNKYRLGREDICRKVGKHHKHIIYQDRNGEDHLRCAYIFSYPARVTPDTIIAKITPRYEYGEVYLINDTLNNIGGKRIAFDNTYEYHCGRYIIRMDSDCNAELSKMVCDGMLKKILYYNIDGDGYAGYTLSVTNEIYDDEDGDEDYKVLCYRINLPILPHYEGDEKHHTNIKSTAVILQQNRNRSAKDIIDHYGEAGAKNIFKVLDTYCFKCNRYRGACMGHDMAE